MKSYPVIIAEDTSYDMDIIENLISGREELTLVGKAVNGSEALKLLKKNSVDLIFLDIDMPVMSGYDLLNIPEGSIPQNIIITTAYPDFAVEAFNHDALDFLVKPITINRFNRAIDRFLERMQNIIPNDKSGNILNISGKGFKHLLNIDDIIYISSHGKKSVIHCGTDDLTIPLMINDLSRMLPENSFLRVHRQYIIRIKQIKSFSSDCTGSYKLLLNDDDDTSLPVGRSYVKSVKDIFG